MEWTESVSTEMGMTPGKGKKNVIINACFIP